MYTLEGGEERVVVVCEVNVRDPAELQALSQRIVRAIAVEHELAAHQVVLIGPRTIPKTSSGKIQRGACREALMRGELPVLRARR